MRRLGIVLGLVALVAMLVSPAVAGNRGVEFIPLGIPAGAPGSFATTISGDGSKVAGSAGGFGAVGGCIVWEEATGWTTLDFNSGACYMSRDGMSFTADQADEFGIARAARWDGTDFVIVDNETNPCGATGTSTYGISDDGSTLVGLGYDTCATARAFSHTEADGITLYDGLTSRASRFNGTNYDGSISVGWNDGAGRLGMKWINGVPEWIVDPSDPEKRAGEAFDVNSDGSAIVGFGYSDIFGARNHGWIWTEENGIRGTGAFGFGFFAQSLNFAVNEAGTMAGGASGFFIFRDATLWTEATGLINLNQFLIDQGRTEYFDGWRLFQVNAMDDRGTRLVVFAKNPFSGFLPNESVIIDISKVSVCHAPPGQPDRARTINIAWESVGDHVGHGDFLGICEAAGNSFPRAASPEQELGIDVTDMRLRRALDSLSLEGSALIPNVPGSLLQMIDEGRIDEITRPDQLQELKQERRRMRRSLSR